MAEKAVIFEDNMETQAGDFNNMQDWIGKSIDDIVVDAVDSGNAYTGFGVTKAAATQVQIAPGRLYWGGPVYIMEDPVVIDFQTVAGAMPVTQQRQVAIVAWGTTTTEDVQPRNFVVDADTGQAQPESVALTTIRLAQVGPVPGVESPSPSHPSISATNLLIAYVLLNPSGVVSIQQVTTTQLDSVTDLSNRVQALEGFEGMAESQINTLQTALAALASQLANYVTINMFQKLSDLVNQIWQIVNRPPNYALDTIDNFFDASQSAVGTNVDGAYNASIQEGIRFNPGATWSGVLQLLNPTEPTIQTWENYILPKPSGMRVRMDCSFPSLDWVAEAILDHPYWVFAPRRLGWARERFRCGVPFLPCPQPAVFAYGGIYDPIYVNFMFDRETWVVVPNYQIVKYPDPDCDWPRYNCGRFTYYWNDYVDVWYWSKTFVNLSYSANHYGQSFLNSQDGWLGGITVFSMIPSYFNPLTLHVYRCDEKGVPDHQQTLAAIDLDANSIQPCYGNPVLAGDLVYAGNYITTLAYDDPQLALFQAQGYVVVQEQYPATGLFDIYYPGYPVFAYPVRINFTPVYLEAGVKYSFHLISSYGHQFACSVSPVCYSVHQGDFWDYDGVSWFRRFAGYKSLKFMLHYLVWGQWQGRQNQAGQLTYNVQLQPLQLAGGIASIDVLADHIIPPATDLSYGVQVSGKWMTFDANPNQPAPIGAATPLLPFEVVFTGTTDLMPAVSLINSQLKLQGPASNSFYHISTSIPRGGSTTVGVKVLANVTSYNSAHHVLNASIHYGSTHMVPSNSSSALMADGTTTQFTWTFNQTGITAYQVEMTGTTDGTGDNFVVSQRSSFSA